jgi:hypothetical protein
MPPDAEAQGVGHGRTLIEKLARPVSRRDSYALTSDGVRCSIALPMSARTSAKAETWRAMNGERHILVANDEDLLAINHAQALWP